jgi:hypothetical protein
MPSMRASTGSGPQFGQRQRADDPAHAFYRGTDNVAGSDHAGHGFARPRVAVRWVRTASSVHRASRRMKPGSQLE